MKEAWRIRGGNDGQRSEQRPAADHSILHNIGNGFPRRPDNGSHSAVASRGQSCPTAAHREHILQHISDHRVTFIQGETGCAKSTVVPQLILDEATARGVGDSVRVIVAQPRRVAAVSLAQYVAHSRGQRVGMDVGFAVSHDRESPFGRTRLTFVTSGYLLEEIWRIRGGGSDGQRREQRPADGTLQSIGNGILPKPDDGIHLQPSGGRIYNTTHGSPIAAHREHILQHISDHRVTFIQGETGCGKSTVVPQFILDDATARGVGESVRVIVAQPRRVAAVSLARYVAQSRGQRVGLDVGYAVSHERACTSGRTRLTFVSSGYLLKWLARDPKVGKITHIVLDEVHVRSVEQDLLLLLLKLLLSGMGLKTTGPSWKLFHSSKLIIMSATMEVRPLQDYFSCLLMKTHEAPAQNVGHPPIIIRGRTFPVKIVHMDEILGYLPCLPKAVADLGTRFLETSGTGVRVLDRTNLPHFAIDLITGLVMHVGNVGDCILVFVATLSDIFEIREGFERVGKSRDATSFPPLDVMFLHSMLSKEDQEAAIAPSRASTLKVIIATNVAESSLTIPDVRVVFDLGHQLQVDHHGQSASRGMTSRIWCSKASARQRAGRVGRLFPGVVIRLYTRDTFNNFSEYETPDIALQNLGSTILRVKSLFRNRFPKFSVLELLQQLLNSPENGDVEDSMQELQNLGAISKPSCSSSDSFELTLLGRLATELAPDVQLARFVLLGVAMGCGVDCVIMAAGISLTDDIFNQPFLGNRDSIMDPMLLQERRIANLRARLHFHGGYASNLLMYCQIFHEWVDTHMMNSDSMSKQWMKRSDLRPSSLDYFLRLVRDYAQKTFAFVMREFGHAMEHELSKLRTLAAIDRCRHKKYNNNGGHETMMPISKFCDNIAIVQIAIAGGFSQNWLIGLPAKDLQCVAETRDLEKANMPPELSYKLKNVPSNLAGPDILKLEMALKVLGPIHRVVPLCDSAVLVQCELQQTRLTSQTSPPVFSDLPDIARLASYMAKSFSKKGELIISRQENSSSTATMEAMYVGDPSDSRRITWKVKLGSDMQGVRFQRLNLIPRSIEVRKDISIHIAVAVETSTTPDTSTVLASNVTVLPPDNLFSILILLMFRPSGPEGEIQVRMLSKSDRIYSIKYQGVTLELGPYFICLPALEYIDGLRAKIKRIVAGQGMENCSMAQDMVNLHQRIQATQFGPPLLAPELGLWLAYPSFIPVNEAAMKEDKAMEKDKGKEEECHHQVNLGSHHQQIPGAASTLQERQSCPVLVQSRNDKCKSVHQASFEKSEQLLSSKSSDLQVFQKAFEAAEVEVDKTQLGEWIGGNKCHNGMFSELLKRLVGIAGHAEHTKVVLQYVHSRRNELINRKQRREMEGLYHLICNPDLVGNIPMSSIGAKAAQTVQLQKQKSQVWSKVIRNVASPEINEDPFITRQVTVNRQQLESVISALQYQQFAARITVGSFSSSHTPGTVTVSGKTRDVEQAIQGIETVINDKQHLPQWMIDDTYIEAMNMDQKVRCVQANGFREYSSKVFRNLEKSKSLEFMLVGESQGGGISRDNSYVCRANSLFNARMKEHFEKALVGLDPGSNIVQIQARLGRVIFASSSGLPFLDGQAKPLGELRKYFDRHQIGKRRFDDAIPSKEYCYLRAGLHLCNPKSVERWTNFILVVSNSRARDEKGREGKLTITEAIDGTFRLQGMEQRTKLAVADVVRLNTGATQVDVRLSLQVHEEDHDSNAEAHDFVSKIVRKGSKLEFPSEPYVVHLQREKDAEIFWFDDIKVTLTNVTQIQGEASRSKNEVEFEAIPSPSEPGSCPAEIMVAVPVSELTSKIHILLRHVQTMSSHLSLRGPSSTATGVVQALLRSWKIYNDEILIKGILIPELFPFGTSNGEAIQGNDQEQVSMQICNLVEVLSHCDTRVLQRGSDVSAELQLVLLHTIHSMDISLPKSMAGRVKRLLGDHTLEPENALQYASLLKCCCSPLDWNWDSVLRPYIMQLILEDQLDILEKFFSCVKLCNGISYYSSTQLIDAIMECSIWTTLSALRRLFYRENFSIFFRLLNAVGTQHETVGSAGSLVRCFVRDLLGFSGWKATSFVGKCLEWTIENQSSILDLETHMQNVFWLLKTIKLLNLSIDGRCRSKILDLLLRLPSSMEQKRDLEETLLDTYGVDETQFRNLHYQRILQQLGYLQDAHKEELKRRGLNERQYYDFNFQSWTPGKIRGRDIIGSSLIPGLNKEGTRLLGSRGIFIPARDPSGKITGGQIKVDDNPEGNRKYVWLSSYERFKGGKGPQLGGELPLFCCIPRDKDLSIVGLCEGGLKAHVLAALSGLPVIGASGADFSRSENLLQSYLVMMDVEQIIFFPDAGSQCNDQVISCYFQTFRLLRDWGYKVLVAWWGQVNKTEHDDIDDYLAKNTGATELPLFSTFQFWQCVNPDVRESLQSKFPEYKTPQERSEIVITDTSQLEVFTDEDQIQIVKEMKPGSYYQIKIPKELMKNMPPAPDDYVTPQSVKIFTIEVLMVQMDDGVGAVEAAMEWLMPGRDANKMLGLDCEHGLKGDLNLIQISTHQRCVLIRLSSSKDFQNCASTRLATVLGNKKVVKSGAEVQIDGLAIYHTLGLMVNGLKNVSPAYKTANRTKGMLQIFRTLYGWEWTKKKAITKSDWGCATLTLEQIKYAALDAWASRMISLKGPATALETPVTCLSSLPEELLKLFARAISNYSISQHTKKTAFETSASISESSQGRLRLLQHDFRSRVTSIGSRVDLHFNDGRRPACFQALTRTGKSVELSPLSIESTGKENRSSALKRTPAAAAFPIIDINSISCVILDNSKSRSPQFGHLREVFYDLLCHPDRCPSLLSLALKCGPAIFEQKPGTVAAAPQFTKTSTVSKKSSHFNAKAKIQTTQEDPAFPKEAPKLESEYFDEVFSPLNFSQREALLQILTSPLSATIGPPGTGKTRLITAVAKAWLHARGDQEVLLCTAYQNVAARNIAEALKEEQVPGVLLLVSEDYFVEWHETFYEKLAKSIVITKAKSELPGALEDWRTRNKRGTVPILVCTLGLVGSRAFTRSLMGGKVTAMIIDECSQAAEGDCIYPLTCLPDLSLLTVLGDPHQLPPFSGSGLGSKSIKVPSIFDLISNGCEVKMIKEQYRMPPKICSFISAEIYNNELQTSPNRRDEKDWHQPLLWINIQGKSTNDPGKTSMYNMAEAQAIVQVCRKLHTKCYMGRGVVVLTMYEEQNRRICKLLEMEPNDLRENVKVHNVDSFQGQQSDIVLISLVAGPNFSPFVADRHRACVMLSRVRRFLCVCGNHDAIRRNSQALLWQTLATFCGARGLVASLKGAESMFDANHFAAPLC
ncbi:unnamed protein product [Calypogeia fissa]